MVTIKSYTDISQSKKLAEILPLESADMVYFGIHQGMDGKYHLSGTNTEDDVIPVYKNLCIKVFTKTTTSDIICMLPCWSLAALLGVLPEIQGGKPAISLNDNYITYPRISDLHTEAGNLVDACYELILKLHELNLL